MNQKQIHRNGIFALAAATSMMLTSHMKAGETIVDDTYGFTLTLPDGFVANPELVNEPNRIVHGFVLGDPTDDAIDIFLLIQRMNGTIGRERLTPETMPPGFEGRLFTTQWQGLEVDAFEVPERLGDTPVVTYNVQIPLKRVAVQVKLFGPADRELELKSLLADILTGLQGESNWNPPTASSNSPEPSAHYKYALLAFGIMFVLGGLVVLSIISRNSPRGTVLIIAAIMYSMGVLLDGVRIREVVLLTGVLRMLGFAGGILGIIDLIRKRKPRSENTQ